MSDAIRRYTDLRAWLRHLLKGSVHAGTSAVLAGAGTNTLEAIPLESLQRVGLDWRQMVAVFVAAAFFEALRRINTVTADTTPPFPPVNIQ